MPNQTKINRSLRKGHEGHKDLNGQVETIFFNFETQIQEDQIEDLPVIITITDIIKSVIQSEIQSSKKPMV